MDLTTVTFGQPAMLGNFKGGNQVHKDMEY